MLKLILVLLFFQTVSSAEVGMNQRLSSYLKASLVSSENKGLPLSRKMTSFQKGNSGNIKLSVSLSKESEFKWRIEYPSDKLVYIYCDSDCYKLSSDFLKSFILHCSSDGIDVSVTVYH